jgi:hypothetical protein
MLTRRELLAGGVMAAAAGCRASAASPIEGAIVGAKPWARPSLAR